MTSPLSRAHRGNPRRLVQLRANIAALAKWIIRKAKAVWRLAFSDEFNGTELPDSKWNRCYPSADPTAARIHGIAALHIRQRHGQRRLAAFDREETIHNGMNYTSGMVTTGRWKNTLVKRTTSRSSTATSKRASRCPRPRSVAGVLDVASDGFRAPEIDVLEVLGHDHQHCVRTVHGARNPPASPYRPSPPLIFPTGSTPLVFVGKRTASSGSSTDSA